MANDSMYPQEYKCPECGEIHKFYVWSSEIETKIFECKSCGARLFYEHVYEKPVVETFRVGRKMNDAEIKADRRKRSAQHFKNEVLPSIGGKDRKYFEKKYGYKK